jgi:predicted alpha/beta-hydrolase family hydrolase
VKYKRHESPEARFEPFEKNFSDGVSVHGFLHRPPERCIGGLVLTHGAGSNCRSPLLLAMAGAFAGAGFLVLRCDLPFRQARAKGPPLRSSDQDREGLRRAALAMRDLLAEPAAISGGGRAQRVFLGGHSYGGRQASMAAAANPELVDGLLLLSYPLHPPRKPNQLRTAHFSRIQGPALFVHGSRDPFGTLEEMRGALALIPAKTRLLPMEGAGHELSADASFPTLAAFQELIG